MGMTKIEIGVSVGAMGTAMAQQHLRNVLVNLDVPTLNQPAHGGQGFYPGTLARALF
jgi:chromate reductase, NAD(P)H dehydrogenase (quinone)